jgi:hypothetical protein
MATINKDKMTDLIVSKICKAIPIKYNERHEWGLILLPGRITFALYL